MWYDPGPKLVFDLLGLYGNRGVLELKLEGLLLKLFLERATGL